MIVQQDVQSQVQDVHSDRPVVLALSRETTGRSARVANREISDRSADSAQASHAIEPPREKVQNDSQIALPAGSIVMTANPGVSAHPGRILPIAVKVAVARTVQSVSPIAHRADSIVMTANPDISAHPGPIRPIAAKVVRGERIAQGISPTVRRAGLIAMTANPGVLARRGRIPPIAAKVVKAEKTVRNVSRIVRRAGLIATTASPGVLAHRADRIRRIAARAAKVGKSAPDVLALRGPTRPIAVKAGKIVRDVRIRPIAGKIAQGVRIHPTAAKAGRIAQDDSRIAVRVRKVAVKDAHSFARSASQGDLDQASDQASSRRRPVSPQKVTPKKALRERRHPSLTSRHPTIAIARGLRSTVTSPTSICQSW